MLFIVAVVPIMPMRLFLVTLRASIAPGLITPATGTLKLFLKTARVPYGAKSRNTIIKFSIENARFLMRYNVKVIVVACNTSSSFALPVLRKSFNVDRNGVV